MQAASPAVLDRPLSPQGGRRQRQDRRLTTDVPARDRARKARPLCGSKLRLVRNRVRSPPAR